MTSTEQEKLQTGQSQGSLKTADDPSKSIKVMGYEKRHGQEIKQTRGAGGRYEHLILSSALSSGTFQHCGVGTGLSVGVRSCASIVRFFGPDISLCSPG